MHIIIYSRAHNMVKYENDISAMCIWCYEQKKFYQFLKKQKLVCFTFLNSISYIKVSFFK